jgi:plasmid stabilization system protein ParE
MRLQWTLSALDDLNSIREFIARDSNIYADSFIDKIFVAVENLQLFPEIGRQVSETNNPKIRELIFQNYRIIYRLQKEDIQILAAVHGSRDIKNVSIKPWDIV